MCIRDRTQTALLHYQRNSLKYEFAYIVIIEYTLVKHLLSSYLYYKTYIHMCKYKNPITDAQPLRPTNTNTVDLCITSYF